jgi:hypothetical protein
VWVVVAFVEMQGVLTPVQVDTMQGMVLLVMVRILLLLLVAR